jgi:hypothetical protein
MPRPRGESWEAPSELDIVIDGLMEGYEDPHEPDVQLDRLERGGDGELDEIRERALDELEGLDAMGRADAAGAIATGPAGMAERMRAERDARAAAWRRVLGAVDARPCGFTLRSSRIPGAAGLLSGPGAEQIAG